MTRKLKRFVSWLTPVLMVAAASLISAVIVHCLTLGAFWAVLFTPLAFIVVRQGLDETVRTFRN